MTHNQGTVLFPSEYPRFFFEDAGFVLFPHSNIGWLGRLLPHAYVPLTGGNACGARRYQSVWTLYFTFWFFFLYKLDATVNTVLVLWTFFQNWLEERRDISRRIDFQTIHCFFTEWHYFKVNVHNWRLKKNNFHCLYNHWGILKTYAQRATHICETEPIRGIKANGVSVSS